MLHNGRGKAVMQKKLLLVKPVRRESCVCESFTQRVAWIPLNLAYIAALTPPDWEIKILDESIEDFRFEEADLVGFTACTQNAPRAYELARVFAERGITTVMGGVHASMLPNEAANYVDAVVVGEAESIWKTVISDFETGTLQRTYVGERTSLQNLVLPRRDLFSYKYPIRGTVQSARGCPEHCDFCSVSVFNGGTYRQRPVNEVLDELEQIDTKLIFFCDDNILGFGTKADERAIQLFKGIIDRGLRIKWYSATTINFIENPEVLKYAKKSGCFNLFIGFESLDETSLRNMGKFPNLRAGAQNYQEIIKRFHDHGIGVIGGFIVGLDNDTKDVFPRVTEFIMSSKIDAAQVSILTPLPGTSIFQRLAREKRLLHTNFPQDWERYDNLGNVLYQPKLMTPDELQEGLMQVYRATTGKVKNVTRALGVLRSTKSFYATGAAYVWNDMLAPYGKNRDLANGPHP
jgi:radical SAM superfamily enzyme YgiQ (UPF0313 family)